MVGWESQVHMLLAHESFTSCCHTHVRCIVQVCCATSNGYGHSANIAAGWQIEVGIFVGREVLAGSFGQKEGKRPAKVGYPHRGLGTAIEVVVGF